MKINFDANHEHGVRFRTGEPLYIYVGFRQYQVPEGFVSDGASVPRFLWRLIDPAVTNQTLVPSIGHDWLYDAQVCTRAEADAWYKRHLLLNRYPRWKTFLVYAGLRLFGWTHWAEPRPGKTRTVNK